MGHSDLPRREVWDLGAHTGTPPGLLHFRATFAFTSAGAKGSGFRVGQPGALSETCLTLMIMMVMLIIPVIVKISVIYYSPVLCQCRPHVI